MKPANRQQCKVANPAARMRWQIRYRGFLPNHARHAAGVFYC